MMYDHRLRRKGIHKYSSLSMQMECNVVALIKCHPDILDVTQVSPSIMPPRLRVPTVRHPPIPASFLTLTAQFRLQRLSDNI